MPRPTRRTRRILAISFNLFRESNKDQAMEDLHRLLRPRKKVAGRRPDVVGLNEAANHRDTIRRAASQLGYEVVTGRGDRDEFNNALLVNQLTTRVKAVWIRRMAVATAGTPERWQVMARLEDIATGVEYEASIDHANSHIENRAWWHLARFATATKHFFTLAAQARRGRLSRLFLGDMNVSFRNAFVRRAPQLAPRMLGRAGAKSSYAVLGMPKLGTHGKRLIDYVFLRVRRSTLRFVRHWVEDGYNSDHRPLCVVLRVKRP